jgi:3-oxoacyl-[acyl-carrier-protein] synthase II
MRRVVVTGVGLITALGRGKEQFWKSILASKSGLSTVTSFDTSEFPVHMGAEVRDFDPGKYIRNRIPGSMGRGSQLAIAAARLAIEDGGVNLAACNRARAGVCMGTTSGEPQVVERYNDIRKAEGLGAVPRRLPPMYPCHVIAGNVAIELDLHGPCLVIPTACAAGNYAIGYGFDAIRSGRVDLMLAGGADPFSRITYTGFARLGTIAPMRCQPFDRNRQGMIPGEGSAVLILESLESAKARGARIYAEILGYGISCDAHHMAVPHPQGEGAMRAMSMAMSQSEVGKADIGYISAHGTGTLTNDRVESLAVRRLFGDRADKIPISSIKSMIGHAMGAASAIEAVACALAIHTGIVPPTINYEMPDPECNLDYVPNHARRIEPRVVLNNAYAFGGNNASLCMSRCEN